MRRKKSLQEKGITLIALVVTIIILLILAGVTLNMALSQDGLFSKTQEAADKYKQAQEDEELEVEKIEYAAEGKDITKVEKISNEEGFKDFRKRVNEGENFENTLIKLSSDLDLENEDWTPIGTKEHPFTGVFNGNGHKISNMKISNNGNDFQGLFGVCNGIIKNIGIESGNIKGGHCAGGIVGLGINCTIEKCFNKANIVVEGDSQENLMNSGGILGSHEEGSKRIFIYRCFNSGEITLIDESENTKTGSGAGGISGVPSGTQEIVECYNSGKVVTTSNSQNPKAGGIAPGRRKNRILL